MSSTHVRVKRIENQLMEIQNLATHAKREMDRAMTDRNEQEPGSLLWNKLDNKYEYASGQYMAYERAIDLILRAIGGDVNES